MQHLGQDLFDFLAVIWPMTPIGSFAYTHSYIPTYLGVGVSTNHKFFKQNFEGRNPIDLFYICFVYHIIYITDSSFKLDLHRLSNSPEKWWGDFCTKSYTKMPQTV